MASNATVQEPFKGLEGVMWIQPDGPNTVEYVLGCHMLDTFSQDLGDSEPQYCPDLSGPNRYRVVGLSNNPPSLADISISGDVGLVSDYLDSIKDCPAAFYVNQSKRGKKSLFSSWDNTYIVPGFRKTSQSWSDLVTKDTNPRTQLSVDAQGLEILGPFRRWGVNRQSTSETRAINSIFSCDELICQSQYATGVKRCDTVYAVADALAGSALGTANVLYNSGAGWTAMAADPFGVSENISAGLCFAVDRDTTRILVFRGTTDAGAAAEVAYTEDNGATWTNVDIGTTNGEYVPTGKAVFALDSNNVWVSTNLGRIYFSNDGGATWTVQENAVIHAAAYNWVQFVDENTGFAGGAADVIAKTTDGGLTWSQATASGNGGDITTGFVHNARQLWVGTDDGEIFYSNDAGVTWNERQFAAVSGSGVIDDMDWLNQFVGIISHRTAVPKSNIYLTRDGGYSWELLNTPANIGINKLLVCTMDVAFAVGEVQGSTPVIYKLNP